MYYTQYISGKCVVHIHLHYYICILYTNTIILYYIYTGEKLEDTWEDARKMLGNSNLLSLLQVREYI